MIPGVAASMLVDVTAGSPYADALIAMDFISGEYSMGGVPVALATLIDKPHQVEANGLRLDWNAIGTQVYCIGDLLAQLITCNWTLVIEWQDLQGSNYFGPLNMYDGSTANLGLDVVYFYTEADWCGFYSQPDPGTNRLAEDLTVTPTLPGIRRAAVTLTNSLLALSVNGRAVVQDVTVGGAVPTTIDAAILGSEQNLAYPDMDGYIRRMILYSPRPAADLVALSTL